VQCPKEKTVALVHGKLSGQLAVGHCPNCQGNWIPAETYESWQEGKSLPENESVLIDRCLNVDYVPSLLDMQAALCPECNGYLTRARVSLKTPFYVERCPNCRGIWCDRGEWELLEQLGLNLILHRFFSNHWQTLTREREQFALERRATIEKLGLDLAERIFALAEELGKHPNGDFGVAYLMRRFDQSS
jgi:Zn-finger nucleic acid-binding protein